MKDVIPSGIYLAILSVLIGEQNTSDMNLRRTLPEHPNRLLLTLAGPLLWSVRMGYIRCSGDAARRSKVNKCD